jgi:hypothetical protein
MRVYGPTDPDENKDSYKVEQKPGGSAHAVAALVGSEKPERWG